jgi:hypothetical protein
MKVKILGWLILSAILVVASCKKDDTPEVDPLVGTYAFSSATFNETVYITIQDVEVEFLADSDATQFVGPGLLSAAPCANAQNAAIELREVGTAFIVCLTEQLEEQLGTWSLNDSRTILTVNISNPNTFLLTIENLTITSNSFTGTVTNFPLPKNTAYALGDPIPDQGFNYQTASVDVTFTRVQ